jgi:uncharacterized repeat protein (TIGR03803 family)
MDGAGNLYGTTVYGGAKDSGTVFELTPSGTGWTEKVLYNFCAQSNCADGATPLAGLIMDGAGNLYGTTKGGGANSQSVAGCGTVFELMPNASKTAWTETVLYSFCSQSGCADGFGSDASLIMDRAGNLYGTSDFIGSSVYGVVFELTPAGTGWKETVLHSFGTADGGGPVASLIMDGAGNLYGTTLYGGSSQSPCSNSGGCGVVFKVSSSGCCTLSVSVVGNPGGR